MYKLNLIALAVILIAVATGGCTNTKKPPKNSSVTDLSVAPMAPHESEMPYANTPAPRPAYLEPAVSQTPAPVAAHTTGGSYVVKKGDTLFSIAKQAYGNGNQWQKIVSANPGLSPTTLKAGQKIVLP